MIIEVDDWNGTPVDDDVVREWIRQGVKEVANFLQKNPEEDQGYYSTMSGDVMVIVDGDRIDGQIFIQGYVLTVRKRIHVTQ